jgi:hypothetical protein
MEFVTINQCLRNYESKEDTKMNLKVIGKSSIYERLDTGTASSNSNMGSNQQEEEEEYIFSDADIVKDLPTTLTDE